MGQSQTGAWAPQAGREGGERWCQAHGSRAGDERAELLLLSTHRRGPGVEGELPDFHEGAQPTEGVEQGRSSAATLGGRCRERQMGACHTTPRASTHPNKARRQDATGKRHVMHALQRKAKKTRHTDPRGRSMCETDTARRACGGRAPRGTPARPQQEALDPTAVRAPLPTPALPRPRERPRHALAPCAVGTGPVLPRGRGLGWAGWPLGSAHTGCPGFLSFASCFSHLVLIYLTQLLCLKT